MYTLIILLCSMGFFMLYNTSRRAKLSVEGSYQRWLQANVAVAKPAGSILIIFSIAALVIKCGWGVGIFTGAILLMASAAYIIAVAPFHYLRWKHIAGIAAFCLLIELFIF